MDGNCTCGNHTGNCPSPTGRTNAGKHPRHRKWLENPITSESAARAEWQQFPDSNIGLVPPDGVVVLDVDPRNGGDRTWDSLVEECGQIEGPTACTGGGGLHIWIRIPQGISLDEARRRIKGALKQRGAGIDIRDANAQVIVAPSMHASGKRYAWMPGRSVLECDPLVPSEPWLRALGLAAGKPEPTAPLVSRADLIRSQHDDLDRARYGLLEVRLLDAGMEYHDWFRVIAALKPLGEAGREIAIQWSKTSSKYRDGDIDRRWESIDGSTSATLFWLFDHASLTWRNDFRRSRGLAPVQSPVGENKTSEQAVVPAQPSQKARALRARTYEEVLAEPPVEFLLEGFLQKDGINLVAGDPSVGKSLFAQDLIQRIARGTPMFGLATIPGSVNYFHAEGSIGPRLRAWEAGNPSATPLIHHVNFVELPDMTSAAEVLAMKSYLAQHPAALNIVDTLGLAAAGADENAASGAASMGMVMREFGRLRDECGGTWVILHHLTKDKTRAALDRIRGSGAIRANCDSIILLEDEGNDTIKVTVGKQRDGATGLKIHLCKLPVSISDKETGVILVTGEAVSDAQSMDIGPAFAVND
ncbi:MAG: AAA family ATPase, partial [Planctomycetota bacterium]